jgi:hypothetical protein
MWAIRPSPCPPTPLSAYCHQHNLCGVLYVCGMGSYWTIRCRGTFVEVSPVSRELDMIRSAAAIAGGECSDGGSCQDRGNFLGELPPYHFHQPWEEIVTSHQVSKRINMLIRFSWKVRLAAWSSLSFLRSLLLLLLRAVFVYPSAHPDAMRDNAWVYSQVGV